jgi:hypothetical protein
LSCGLAKVVFFSDYDLQPWTLMKDSWSEREAQYL